MVPKSHIQTVKIVNALPEKARNKKEPPIQQVGPFVSETRCLFPPHPAPPASAKDLSYDLPAVFPSIPTAEFIAALGKFSYQKVPEPFMKDFAAISEVRVFHRSTGNAGVHIENMLLLEKLFQRSAKRFPDPPAAEIFLFID